MTRLSAILSAVAVVALLAVAVVFALRPDSEGDKYAQCRGMQVAGGTASIGGPFTLIDETGQTVTDTDVITKPSLLYFGYTFCPDVCPLDNARNAEAVSILDERGYDVNPVFITIDPARDTPEVMGEFSDYMHEKMIGLSGSPEQIKAVSQAYRTYYAKRQTEDEEFYLMDHSTFTYLVFPGEGFIDYFRREETPEQMADRVTCFIDASKN
ncbi:SCO family protein [Actibacterium lipolyticum]|uniref:SCO1/SenC n=1 Tax=Actibacterium lipolyticum TaxID=1524263 RepID=A0A238KWI8_9RHOB|nr:SCO family protein [Actibacterium lipolyticum]SMX47173.1 SCO1/SenC [Actibacterium lipolyticum]